MIRGADPVADFRAAIDVFADASVNLDTLIAETGDTVKATKEGATLHEIEIAKRATLLEAAATAKTAEAKAQFELEAKEAVTTEPVDFKTALQPVLDRMPEFKEANAALTAAINGVQQKLPASLPDAKADRCRL